MSDYKTLGIFCCQSNPITAKFWMERVGYVPGEKIYFNAEVENLSRKSMHGSKVEIIEVKWFMSFERPLVPICKFNLILITENALSRIRWDRVERESHLSVFTREFQPCHVLGKSSDMCSFGSPFIRTSILSNYRCILSDSGKNYSNNYDLPDFFNCIPCCSLLLILAHFHLTWSLLNLF